MNFYGNFLQKLSRKNFFRINYLECQMPLRNNPRFDKIETFLDGIRRWLNKLVVQSESSIFTNSDWARGLKYNILLVKEIFRGDFQEFNYKTFGAMTVSKQLISQKCSILKFLGIPMKNPLHKQNVLFQYGGYHKIKHFACHRDFFLHEIPRIKRTQNASFPVYTV